MSRRALVVVVVLGLALWAWRSQLFVVSRPGEGPRALAVRAPAERGAADLDVVLPAVPVGTSRLRDGEGVLLLHYWAPWERRGARQAADLDSLSQLAELSGLGVALVCFDPFPSVARYVARRRLRLTVLLDPDRRLRRVLPCPSVPYTYVLDAHGRIAIAQPGEVDWLGPGTRAVLLGLIGESPPPGTGLKVLAPSRTRPARPAGRPQPAAAW